MSHIEKWGIERSGNETILSAIAREGYDGGDIATNFRNTTPDGVSVRSLQAAASPGNYNLRDYPGIKKQAERIAYREEPITLGEAKDPSGEHRLDGKVTSDDEFDFDDDDVVFVRHVWTVPSDLPELR